MTGNNQMTTREAADRERAPRILLIAYACEPNKGSEAGTGWNLALALAREFRVTVATRANNEPPIQAVLEGQAGLRPEFMFVDPPSWVLALKQKRVLPVQLFYYLWQRAVGQAMRASKESFDFVHQLTFNTFEVPPAAFSSASGRRIWGPIGGGQTAPSSLLPLFAWRARCKELFRTARVGISARNPFLTRRLATIDAVLYANRETQRLLCRGDEEVADLMIDVGVSADAFPCVGAGCREKRIVFAGAIEPRKGLCLLLRAFKRAIGLETDLRLSIVGEGIELPAQRELAKELGIDGAVEFRGRVDHSEMASEFRRASVFAFPSLRDTSGAVVLEAMSSGLPIVAMDHQGVALMVGDEAGVLVPVGSPDETIERFAEAMLRVIRNDKERDRMGEAARSRVLERFVWEKKAARISALYREMFGQETVSIGKG